MRPPVNNGIDAPTLTVQLFTKLFQFGTPPVGNATRPNDDESVRFGRYSDLAIFRCISCAVSDSSSWRTDERASVVVSDCRTIESLIANTSVVSAALSFDAAVTRAFAAAST